jgi:hypothetical protein
MSPAEKACISPAPGVQRNCKTRTRVGSESAAKKALLTSSRGTRRRGLARDDEELATGCSERIRE